MSRTCVVGSNFSIARAFSSYEIPNNSTNMQDPQQPVPSVLSDRWRAITNVMIMSFLLLKLALALSHLNSAALPSRP